MALPFTTGLTVSLQADTNVFTDAAKSIAAATAGDLVYTWADLSGNGNDIIQATAANRPAFQPNIVNSLPVVRFGSGAVFTNLVKASGLSLSSQAQTIFIVFRPNARNTQTTFAAQSAQNVYHNTGFFSVYDGTNTRQAAAGTVGPLRDWQVLTVIFDTTSITFRLNGTATGYSTTVLQAAAATLTSLYLGTNFSNAQFWNGDIAEFHLFSGALSGANAASNEAYLKTKYAIPAAQPTNAALVVFEGDSLTEGVGTTLNIFEFPEEAYQGANAASPYNYVNLAVSGSQVSDMTNRASTVDSYYSSSRAKNILYVWAGTNDLVLGGLTPTNAYNGLVTYCNARRAVGWKVIVRTMIPRQSYSDANRLAFNASIRTNWATFADGLDDLGAHPVLGQNGAQNNTILYNADTIHLTNSGQGFAAAYASAACTKILYTPTGFRRIGFTGGIAG